MPKGRPALDPKQAIGTYPCAVERVAVTEDGAVIPSRFGVPFAAWSQGERFTDGCPTCHHALLVHRIEYGIPVGRCEVCALMVEMPPDA